LGDSKLRPDAGEVIKGTRISARSKNLPFLDALNSARKIGNVNILSFPSPTVSINALPLNILKQNGSLKTKEVV
jgi:hypothetical protein